VYVYAGVRWDLVHKFYEEVGSEPVREATPGTSRGELHVTTHRLNTRGAHIRFERPVVSHCPEWGNTLNVIDNESFSHFKKWILQQQFVNSEERKFYIIRHYGATMLDPLELDLSGKPVVDYIDVFSVCGMKGILAVKHVTPATAKAYVELEHRPPEEAITVIGSAALKIARGS
jgi:hypothetical protein